MDIASIPVLVEPGFLQAEPPHQVTVVLRPEEDAVGLIPQPIYHQFLAEMGLEC